jgi:signal transduction histidine kinase
MTNLVKIYRHFMDVSDRLMALMILSLHALLIWGGITGLDVALFLIHYALFLLWQPVLRTSSQWFKLSWQTATLIILGALIGLVFIWFFLSWWVVAFWIASLFALIGGRILSDENTRSRLPNILAASYLLAILLLWVVPKLLQATDDLAAAEFLLIYFLPILPLIILFISASAHTDNASTNIDFFYTLLIFLITIIVILGSYAIGVIWRVHYIELLIFAVLGVAATLVALSWLWNPSATFSGLELLMSRYLLSLGLPFEQWIRQIAQHAENTQHADKFLETSMRELAALNWVKGLVWQINQQTHQLGEPSEHISTFTFAELHLTLYSRWQFSPSMYLHVQLLTQILGEFYEAKRREETISQTTYMQTFYETGSRLTHDIKNILQSLGTLTAASQQVTDESDDARLLVLVKQQLPRLNQRLSMTLSKLERPSVEKKTQAKVANWWKSYKQLNMHAQIHFESLNRFPNSNIQLEVVESVVDNLLQNALEKAKREPNLNIYVKLLPHEHFCLDVTDTGSEIPEEIANRLFKAHINSATGLGVGLYHAAQQAAQSGYQLSLLNNQNGAVTFRLEIISVDNSEDTHEN